MFAEYRRAQIRLRRDVAENWEILNPILSAGEAGIEMTDTDPPQARYLKMGNGVTPWNELPYLEFTAPDSIDGGTIP